MILCGLLFNLAAQAQLTVSGTVTDETGETLIGVSISEKGTSNGTISDADGMYKMQVSGQQAILVFSYVGYAEKSIPVDPSGKMDVQLQSGELDLSEVVVIGSRSASRTKLSTPVPVDVINIAGLASQAPQLDMNQLLQYAAPSFQANAQTISDGTDHIDPASLRGLGPDQVLVLVNGKRRHTTSLVNVNGTFGRGSVGTDLNTIPLAAIERVEILRDGAAAQYGSDAIAGVINIVLKEKTNQLDVTASTGAYFSSYDSENTDDSGKFNDGQRYQVGANYGYGLANGGFINVSGEYSERGATNRMLEWKGNIFSSNGQSFDDGMGNLLTDDQVLAARGLDRSDFNMRVGNSAVQNTALVANMAMPLAGGAEFYAFGGINYRHGNAAGFYRFPYESRNVLAIYQNGFLPEIHSNIVDKSVSAGIRGKIGKWNVDLNNTYGQNAFQFQIENTLNASLLDASPTSFNSGGFSFSQNVSGLHFTRRFDNVMKGLNVAFGSEFRVDNYQIVAGEEGSYTNYGLRTVYDLDTLSNGTVYVNDSKTVDILGRPGGAQVFPGFRPDDAGTFYRTNLAGYLDAELDITKSLLLGAAVRAEEYSDFGSTLTGKVTARFNPISQLAIRAAYSTGFRAPSLQQIHFTAVSTNFINGVPFEVGTFANDSRAASVLGIPALKEETSENISFGITAMPASGLEITLDAYQIGIKDRVVLTGNFGGSSQPEIQAELSAIGADAGRFFTNAVDTRTRGLDIILTYSMKVGAGQLRTSLAGNYNKTEIQKINATPKLEPYINSYMGREDQSLLETSTPETKFNLTFNYKIGKFNAMLRGVYYGEVTYRSTNANPQLNSFTGEMEVADQTFGGKLVTDLSLGYHITPKVNLAVGANNLLDVYPDEHAHSANYSSGRFIFSRRATQFGFNGRFVFARLGLTL